MRAWDAVIQKLRARDIPGAIQAYQFAAQVTKAEATSVIESAVQKITTTVYKEKKHEHENVFDPTDKQQRSESPGEGDESPGGASSGGHGHQA